MKKLVFFLAALFSFTLVSGCIDNAIKPIKADTLDISYGQTLYEGAGKMDESTTQSLVKAYNKIEYSGQTSEQIDFDKAITITYIYRDQISGTLVIDESGIFQISDGKGNYQIDSGQKIYEQALDIFKQLEKKH